MSKNGPKDRKDHANRFDEQGCRLRAGKASGSQDSGFGIQEKKSRRKARGKGVFSSGPSFS
jgi:hypothetical protein